MRIERWGLKNIIDYNFTFPKIEKVDNIIIELVQFKESESFDLQGQGSFLGASIKGKDVYQYIIIQKFPDGRMKKKFLNKETTYIIETDENPHVEYKTFKKSYPKWRSLPWLWDEEEIYFILDDAEIYIPKNSVIIDYNKI